MTARRRPSATTPPPRGGRRGSATAAPSKTPRPRRAARAATRSTSTRADSAGKDGCPSIPSRALHRSPLAVTAPRRTRRPRSGPARSRQRESHSTKPSNRSTARWSWPASRSQIASSIGSLGSGSSPPGNNCSNSKLRRAPPAATSTSGTGTAPSTSPQYASPGTHHPRSNSRSGPPTSPPTAGASINPLGYRQPPDTTAGRLRGRTRSRTHGTAPGGAACDTPGREPQCPRTAGARAPVTRPTTTAARSAVAQSRPPQLSCNPPLERKSSPLQLTPL
jgi:hypothetical protein